VCKNIHANTHSGLTLAVAFLTYCIHPVSCTNRIDCCIGTARCTTSAE